MPLVSSINAKKVSTQHLTSQLPTATPEHDIQKCKQRITELEKIYEKESCAPKDISISTCLRLARSTNICIDNCANASETGIHTCSQNILMQGHGSLSQVNDFLQKASEQSISCEKITLNLMENNIYNFSMHMRNTQ